MDKDTLIITPLDHLVREIFEVTNTPYWDDRAAETAELIKAFISEHLHIDYEPNDSGNPQGITISNNEIAKLSQSSL